MEIRRAIVENSQILTIVNTFFDMDSLNTKQKYTMYKKAMEYTEYLTISGFCICVKRQIITN